MSDLIRGMRQCTAEQEQRETQRAINRLTRAVRQSAYSSPSFAPPQRPTFPGGVVPVLLLNPPILRR